MKKPVNSVYISIRDLKNNEYPYHISLSVGYAPIVGTGESAVEEAVKKADEELYKEKEFMHKGIEQLNQLLT